MRIYTKTGDDGTTGLFGGARVAKDDLRIEAYGTIDELNSVLGVARAAGLPPDIDEVVTRVQHDLFALGAELASSGAQRANAMFLNAASAEAIEATIDRFEATLPPLKEFILPAGAPGAAALHLARTICRRAERRLVSLSKAPDAQLRSLAVVYLNRLADLLFVLARAANQLAGQADAPWKKP